jgi:hypothetical protein
VHIRRELAALVFVSEEVSYYREYGAGRLHRHMPS